MCLPVPYVIIHLILCEYIYVTPDRLIGTQIPSVAPDLHEDILNDVFSSLRVFNQITDKIIE